MKAEPVDPEKSAGNRVLLFAWKRRRAVLSSLGIFLVASLIVHLAGFYLFQVVYPASGRLEPEPLRVTLLDQSQPSVDALMREVEDRLVYLRPASSGSDVRVSLGEFSAQFQPSFSDRNIEFKSAPLSSETGNGTWPPRFEDGLDTGDRRDRGLVLPPLSAPPGAGEVRPVDTESGRWRISGDLEAREITNPAAFESRLPALEQPPAIRFRIGVRENGAVFSILPVAGQRHPRIESVTDAVREGLQFEPEPGAGNAWGWVEINR